MKKNPQGPVLSFEVITSFESGDSKLDSLYEKKYELMKRDPLAAKLERAIKDYASCVQNEYQEALEKTGPEEAYKVSGLSDKADALNSLIDALCEKWNVSDIYIPDAPIAYLRDHPFWIMMAPPLFRLRLVTPRSYLPTAEGSWIQAKEEHSYIEVPPHFKTHDIEKMKREFGDILKAHIAHRKEKGQPACAEKEPEEIRFLYYLKEETFTKYLRWYDLHTKEHLSFRLMAHIENMRSKHPLTASGVLEKVKNTEKVRWGSPVKGEDNIGKGVQLIWKAIHRTEDRSSQEPLIEEYNCPSHGNDCDASCSYFKEWTIRFNRLFPKN
jgi:hypothetical protein